MLQPLLEDTSIVGVDDLKNYNGKYGTLVKRVMRVVGADVVQFRIYDIALSVYIAKGQEVILEGPFLTMENFGDVEGLFEKFLEAMFIDNEEENKIHRMTCLDLWLHQRKFDDKYGILSKSFSELDIKLTILGF